MPPIKMKSKQNPLGNVFIIGVATICCVSNAAASSKPSQTSSSSTSSSLNEIANNIDAFVQSVMECHQSPALTLTVVKDGQVVISKGYGHTSASKTHKVTSTTKFGIGSLTKAFTSLLVMKALNETEGISLDTPMSKYLKDFRLVDDYRSEHASLRDILSHRMAIPAYDTPLLMGFDPIISRMELARKLKFLESPHSFREKFIYNNYMYILAGEILERLSQDRSWESLVNETIFQPLGMTQSGFLDHLADFNDNFALPCHVKNGTLFDLTPELFKMVHVAGPAGSIYSTADDMAKWMMFLLLLSNDNYSTSSTTGFDNSMLQMTFEPSMAMKGERFYKPEFPVSYQENDYCAGWMSAQYRGFKQIFHTGEIVTHNSVLWLYPDADVGIFVEVNGPADIKGDMLTAITYFVSDLMLGLPTWFNVSDVCSKDTMPWSKDEGGNEEEDDDDGAKPNQTQFICSTATNCNLSDYIGTYSHAAFGDALISRNKMDDNILTNGNDTSSSNTTLNFTFGRFGFLELTPKNRSVFSGRFMGPLSYIDGKVMVIFSFFENGHRVSSLAVNDAGSFFKQNISGPHNNSGSTIGLDYIRDVFFRVLFWLLIAQVLYFNQ